MKRKPTIYLGRDENKIRGKEEPVPMFLVFDKFSMIIDFHLADSVSLIKV